MQVNANLTKFEQYKHISVNDARRSYNDTLRVGRNKWHKIKLGGTIKLKSLRDPQAGRKTNSDYKQQCIS